MDRHATNLEVRAQRVEMRSRFLAILAAVSLVGAGALALVLQGTHHGARLDVMSAMIAALTALGPLPVMAIVALDRRRAEGKLRVDERRLLWDGRPVFERGTVRDAIAYTNGDAHGVRVKSRWRTAYFEVGTAEEADRIVAALGKDSGQAAVSFGSGLGSLFVGFSYVNVIGQSHDRAWLFFGLVLMLLPMIVELATRQRWLVGADGLLVRRGFGRGHFVPYADVTEVAVEGDTVALSLRDGKSLKMKTSNDAGRSDRPVVGVRALARRIDQARTRAASRRSSEDVTHLLARGDRTIEAWMRELEEVETRTATYRVAAVRRETLWSTLEDAAQPPEVRAAAVVALRPRLGDEERSRLRVMAGACASPKLRVAFEAAAERDARRLTEALEDFGEGGDDLPMREKGGASSAQRGS